MLTCKKTKSGSIKTVNRWFEAFRNFTAIYTAKYPAHTPLLRKYADTVQRLGKQAGDGAALYYDKQFRLWRQDTPELLPWNQLNSESFNQALAMGLVTKSNGKFRTQRKKKKKKRNKKGKTKKTKQNKKKNNKKTKKTGPKKRYCLWFNNHGQCNRPQCPFEHLCQKCDGSHSKKQCTSNSKDNATEQPSDEEQTKQSNKIATTINASQLECWLEGFGIRNNVF